MSTGNDENIFIQDGKLVIQPTLQEEVLVEANNAINLTKDGTCTSKDWMNCVGVTNTT